MITRSDIEVTGISPLNIKSYDVSQMGESLRHRMYAPDSSHSNENVYPSSIYQIDHIEDMEVEEKPLNTDEESVSTKFKNLVDDLLKFSHEDEEEEEEEECPLKDVACSVIPTETKTVIINRNNSTTFSSFNSIICKENSTESYLDKPIRIKENCISYEEEEFCYSSPNTPTDSNNHNNNNNSSKINNYSTSIVHSETIPYSPGTKDFEMEEDYPSTNITSNPLSLKRRNHDTSALMYDNDDMTIFTGLVNCNEVLRHHRRSSDTQERPYSPKETANVFTFTRESISSPESNNNIRNLEEKNKEYEGSFPETSDEDPDSRKGKITGLQRKALDSIFSVTDRPSRGLVLHIAGELNLHHITVKNFFSNGRRRLRRAAARLNDPERTRRENQKRKEKRRLAALAAAASAAISDKNNPRGPGDGNGDSQGKEPSILSPERRALMEKLAVKVQRSVAQKGLAANLATNPGGTLGLGGGGIRTLEGLESTSGISKMGTSSGALVSLSCVAGDTITSPNNRGDSIASPLYSPSMPYKSTFYSHHYNTVASKPQSHSSPSAPSPSTSNQSYSTHTIEEPYTNQNGELGSIMSCSENEAVPFYNSSSPTQNRCSVWSNEPEQNIHNYYSVNNREEINWQTLLEA